MYKIDRSMRKLKEKYFFTQLLNLQFKLEILILVKFFHNVLFSSRSAINETIYTIMKNKKHSGLFKYVFFK